MRVDPKRSQALYTPLPLGARVAELVDAADSKSAALKSVSVRFRPRAPLPPASETFGKNGLPAQRTRGHFRGNPHAAVMSRATLEHFLTDLTGRKPAVQPLS